MKKTCIKILYKYLGGIIIQVTIKDVAKEAGVSPSTVSRVLNKNPRISEDTKIKVMKAVKKLNYYPNTAAQSLVNKSTKTIGIVIPSNADDLFKNPFWINVIRGISIYAQKMGYYISFATSKNEEEEIRILKDYVMRKVVDGIILLTARTRDKSIRYLQEADFPFSVVGKPDNSSNILWVDNDNFGMMQKVVTMLIEKGHKNIGFIGGPKEMNVSKDRLLGYKEALKINNIDYNEDYIIHGEDFTENIGYNLAKQLLKSIEITAVVTTDDILSIGLNKYVKNLKNRDIAIVGFNNAPLVEYQEPKLASVDIKAEELGYNSAKLLIEFLLDGKIKENYYIVPAQIIQRESMFSI